MMREANRLRDPRRIAASISLHVGGHTLGEREYILRHAIGNRAEEHRDVEIIALERIELGASTLIHLHADAPQVLSKLMHGIDAATIDTEGLLIRPQRHTKVAQLLVTARQNLHRPCGLFCFSGCDQHIEREFEIRSAACDRSGNPERRHDPCARHRRNVAAQGTIP